MPQAGSSIVRTMPGRAQRLVVLDEEEVDHEADDLAGREVLAGGLVRQLAENLRISSS